MRKTWWKILVIGGHKKIGELVFFNLLVLFQVVKYVFIHFSPSTVTLTPFFTILYKLNKNFKLQKVTTDEGEVKPLFVLAYSKANKRFTARSVKVEKDYGYIRYIMRKIVKRTRENKKTSKRSLWKRQCFLNARPLEWPPRPEIIENSTKYKRIKLN